MLERLRTVKVSLQVTELLGLGIVIEDGLLKVPQGMMCTRLKTWTDN